LEHQGHKEHQGHQEVGASLDALARAVVDAGFKVHRTLGPGLLETVYELCLARELELRGLVVMRQVSLPIVYEGLEIDGAFRIDLLVNDALIVEVKAVDALARVHEAQLLTYLKLSNRRLGLLINFNVELFKQGVRRFVR